MQDIIDQAGQKLRVSDELLTEIKKAEQEGYWYLVINPDGFETIISLPLQKIIA